MRSISVKGVFLGLVCLSSSVMSEPDDGHSRAFRPTASVRMELRSLMGRYKESRVPERLKPGGDPNYDYMAWNFKTQSWLHAGKYGEAVIFLHSSPGSGTETIVTAVTERGAYSYRLPDLGSRGGNFALDVEAVGRIELGLHPMGEKDVTGRPLYSLSAAAGNIEAYGRLAVTYPAERNPMAISLLRDAISKMEEQSDAGLRRAGDYRLPGYIPNPRVQTRSWSWSWFR